MTEQQSVQRPIGRAAVQQPPVLPGEPGSIAALRADRDRLAAALSHASGQLAAAEAAAEAAALADSLREALSGTPVVALSELAPYADDPEAQPSEALRELVALLGRQYPCIAYDPQDRPARILAIRRAAHAAGAIPIPSNALPPRSICGAEAPTATAQLCTAGSAAEGRPVR